MPQDAFWSWRKVILTLKYIEEVRRDQIASKLSIGIDAVDKRLQKCKAAWKEIYERISEMHYTTREAL